MPLNKLTVRKWWAAGSVNMAIWSEKQPCGEAAGKKAACRRSMPQNQDTGAKKEREIAAWSKQIWGLSLNTKIRFQLIAQSTCPWNRPIFKGNYPIRKSREPIWVSNTRPILKISMIYLSCYDGGIPPFSSIDLQVISFLSSSGLWLHNQVCYFFTLLKISVYDKNGEAIVVCSLEMK